MVTLVPTSPPPSEPMVRSGAAGTVAEGDGFGVRVGSGLGAVASNVGEGAGAVDAG
jgi:hypothetical protein